MKKNHTNGLQKVKLAGVLVFLSVLLSGCTLADFWGGKASDTLTRDDIIVVLNNVINWLLGGIGGVAVIFIIVGGYMYIVSRGNQESAQKAKSIILWAVFGLILVIAAYTIVRLLMKFFLSEDYFNQIVG